MHTGVKFGKGMDMDGLDERFCMQRFGVDAVVESGMSFCGD